MVKSLRIKCKRIKYKEKGKIGMKKEYQNKLDVRLFDFAIRTINFLRSIKNSQEISVIKYQLSKSATSAGANYEEAQPLLHLMIFQQNKYFIMRDEGIKLLLTHL